MSAVLARRSHEQAELISACAERHGVSRRSVNNWRTDGDPRWTEFLASLAVGNGGSHPNVPEDHAEPHGDPLGPPDAPEGIAAEIGRLRTECRGLAWRAGQMAKSGNLVGESTLHRILDSKRETLRRLEVANPDIGRDTGALVEKHRVVSYVGACKSILLALPSRLGSILPSDLDVEFRERADAEIRATLESLASLDFDQPAVS